MWCKKFFAIAAVGFLPALGVWAYDFEMEGIYYSILPDDAGVEVTHGSANAAPSPMRITATPQAYDFLMEEGNSYSGDVVIPASVEYAGTTYQVTSIGRAAFLKCQSLGSVTLPETITQIKEGAFALSSVSGLTLPDALVLLGEAAFMNADALSEITLPAEVTFIPECCFSGSGLQTVAGIDHLTGIGNYGFSGTRLTELSLPDNPDFRLGLNVFTHSDITELTLPSNSKLEGYDFDDVSQLATIILPSQAAELYPFTMNNCPKCNLLRISNPEPPELLEAWAPEILSACTLEVPQESLSAYNQAPGWKDFSEIRAIGSAGIEGVDASDIQIRVSGHDIEIAGNPAHCRVFDMTGRETGRKNLSPGIYVVSAEGKALKVVVR